MEALKKISGIEKAVNELVAGVTERRAGIENELTPYINGVVTAETLQDWKKDRARLNKEKTALDGERKEFDINEFPFDEPESKEFVAYKVVIEKAQEHNVLLFLASIGAYTEEL